MPATAPERPRRATALPADERRAAIVAAVLPLLVEHGGHATTKQIADAAGIAEGTIFRVFTDKDELLSAALDAALDTAALEDELGRIDPDLAFEQRLVRATTIIQRRVVDVWSIYSGINPKHRRQRSEPPPDSPALTAIFVSDVDRLRLAPADAARMLRAMTLSLTHPMLAGAPAPPEVIVDTVLHGIGARP